MLRKNGAEAPFSLAPDAATHLWTDRAETVQHVNTARHTVVVDVVLTNDTQADTVVNCAGSHVNTLWQQQVSSCKGDGVLVIDQVLSVLVEAAPTNTTAASCRQALTVAKACVGSRVDRSNSHSDVQCYGSSIAKATNWNNEPVDSRVCGFTANNQLTVNTSPALIVVARTNSQHAG
jgi:hypothetical protein